MVMADKQRSTKILLSLSIVSLITILSIGITVRVQTADFRDESAAVVITPNGDEGKVPNIIGYDEEQACEILLGQGFLLKSGMD